MAGLIEISTSPRILLNSDKTRVAVQWDVPAAKKLQVLAPGHGEVRALGGAPMLVLPYNHDTFIAAQAAGLPVPSPIRYAYQWKGRYKPMAHQETTAAFFTRYKKCFCFNEMGCVSDDTEFLTPTGWKRIDQYAGEEVGQYDPETEQVSFVANPEYVKLPCATMLHITAPGIDQLISLEHRVLLQDKLDPTRREVVQAFDLFYRYRDYQRDYQRGWRSDELKPGEIPIHRASIPAAFTASKGVIRSHTQDCLLLAPPRLDGCWDSEGVMSLEPSPDGFKYCFMVPTTFLVLRRNGCIFCTGNTGKSLSALWAADHLIEQKVIRQVLILSPLSTLTPTWASELFSHFPHHRFAILHGKGKALVKDPSIRFFIANHEAVRDRALDRLILNSAIDLVIVDECAMFRNAQTDKWKGLNSLVSRMARVWAMTGTPTPNAPTDAWAQIRLLYPDRVSRSFIDFRAATMVMDGPYKYRAKPDAESTIRRLFTPAIRFAAKDCLDLPPLTYERRKVEMTKEQKGLYKTMAREALIELEGKQITAANEAVLASKLLQIACGVVLHEGHGFSIQTPKIGTLEEIIEQTEGKLIIFAPFTSVVHHIARKLEDHNVAVITGQAALGERNRIFESFQNNKDGVRIIVAQPRTMSHGLTLTAAATMVWFAPIWSNDTYQQAVARIHRTGQRRHCTVLELESSPVEHEIYVRLRERQRVQGLLLDLLKKNLDKS